MIAAELWDSCKAGCSLAVKSPQWHQGKDAFSEPAGSHDAFAGTSVALDYPTAFPQGRNLDPKRQSLPKELACAHGENTLNEENHVPVPILSALKEACE